MLLFTTLLVPSTRI